MGREGQAEASPGRSEASTQPAVVPTVMVLGASGGIGCAVCRWILANTRFSVLAQRRRDAPPPHSGPSKSQQPQPPLCAEFPGRISWLTGDPGAQVFWDANAETLFPSAAQDPDSEGRRVDERLYLLGDAVEARVEQGDLPALRRIVRGIPAGSDPVRLLAAVACCTGSLRIKSLADTTTDDLNAAMSAHLAPLLLAIRNVASWNSRTVFFACGSDPLSREGSVDCATYVAAKFAQRGLLACAAEEYPRATFREALLPNTASALWSGAGLEAPEGSISTGEAARMLVGDAAGLLGGVTDRVLEAFGLRLRGAAGPPPAGPPTP